MKATRMLLVTSLLVLCASFGSAAAPTPEPPDLTPEPCGETTIVRVYYPDLATRNQILISFEAQVQETNYEGGYHILQVTQADIDRLRAAGLRVEADATWVAPAVRPPAEASAQTIPGYSCYRTVEETFAAAQALVSAHPELATWSDAGDSWDKATAGGATGYDLMVLKLTNSAIGGEKPDLFVTASIHAREYTPAEVVTRFAEHLVNNYGINADATWILDHHEIHLLLQANPDGRKWAEQGYTWRKNTRENCSYNLSRLPEGDGIDLNRNYTFKWGCCGGSSGTPCATTYRGATAGSEPETVAVQAYMGAIFPDQRGPADTDAAPATTTGIYLDMHSYGQLVLWPWGWTSTNAPNYTQLQTLGRKFAFFNNHTPQKAYALYATDGSTHDHAYGVLGVAAYCFEMGTSFFQPCSTFESTIYPTNFRALFYAAKVVRTPYITPLGPDAVNLALSAGTTPANVPVSLTAVISDTGYSTANGSEPMQDIAAAEYYMDVPPWNGGTAHAMSSADGSLDSEIEGMSATINTSALSPGRHIVFVRGQDADGNWGAFSAIFLTIEEPTAVELRSFTATAAAKGIRLAWETVSERDLVGFNLYRGSQAAGTRVRVNEDGIATRVAPGSSGGSGYEYADGPLTGGRTYYYWLEVVDIHGRTELHGPLQVRAR